MSLKDSQDIERFGLAGDKDDVSWTRECHANESRRQAKKRLFWIVASFLTCSLLVARTLPHYLDGLLLSGAPCPGRTKHASHAAEGLNGQPFFTVPGSGDKIPAVALGTWRAGRGEVGDAVKVALEEGYRHIDGAWIYGNEVEVGQAIKDSGVPREDIFITSKLWNDFHAPEDVESALDETLARLDTSYVDLYLIHWPQATKKGTNREIDWDLTLHPMKTWKKLEEMLEKGKVKNIGVSNFNVTQLELITRDPSVKHLPSVNQVQINWFEPKSDLVEYSKKNNILLEAYSPFGSSERVGDALNVKEIKDVAAELGITPAQVTLSWLYQRGLIVLPKSVHASRIVENFKLTKLPKKLFKRLEKHAGKYN